MVRLRSEWRPSGLYMSFASVGVLLLAAVGHTGGEMAWPAMGAHVAVENGGSGISTPQEIHGPSTATVGESTTPTLIERKSRSVQTGADHQPNHQVAPHQETASSPSQSTPWSTKSASSPEESTRAATSTPSTSYVFHVGETSLAIRELQQALTNVHDFHHSFTTYYGPITEAAVQDFQTQQGLTPTGQVDEHTLRLLEQLSGVRIAATSPSSSATQASTTSTSRNSSTASPSTSSEGTQASVDQIQLQSGYRAFVASCQSCHALSVATQYEGVYSQSTWNQVIAQMESYAGRAFPNAQDIVYYLSHAHQ